MNFRILNFPSGAFPGGMFPGGEDPAKKLYEDVKATGARALRKYRSEHIACDHVHQDLVGLFKLAAADLAALCEPEEAIKFLSQEGIFSHAGKKQEMLKAVMRANPYSFEESLWFKNYEAKPSEAMARANAIVLAEQIHTSLIDYWEYSPPLAQYVEKAALSERSLRETSILATQHALVDYVASVGRSAPLNSAPGHLNVVNSDVKGAHIWTTKADSVKKLTMG